MDNFDEILNQLKDSSGELKDNLHILEEIIPIEEQMKYFEYSKRIKENQGYVDRNYLVALLFSPEVRLEEKRYSLTVLAGLADIAAYRSIETYHSSPLEPELAHWSALALIESRILIDSDLSGEKQFLISTGLGGLNGRLRFFAVVVTKDRSDYNDLQKEMLRREFKFEFEREKITVEDFSVLGNHLTILLLSDLKRDLKSIFWNVITECNQFGDYIDEKFLLTNVKQFNETEIQRLISRKDEEDNSHNLP